MDYSTIQFFKNKACALKKLRDNDILCNRGITKYFAMKNHQEFLDYIKSADIKDFYEFINALMAVALFFDVEIYKDASEFFDSPETLLQHIDDKVKSTLQSIDPNLFVHKRIVLQSHNESKKSFHILYNILGGSSPEASSSSAPVKHCLFQNVKALKDFYNLCEFGTFKDSSNKHLIDPSVYREGIFRTIYSSKPNENRPLLKDPLSNDFDDIQTFVSYYSTQPHEIINFTNVVPLQSNSSSVTPAPSTICNEDKAVVTQFVTEVFNVPKAKIRDILLEDTCIIVALNEKFCHFFERDHRSNNQYIVLDNVSAKQKCHDTDCKDKKHNEVPFSDFPTSVINVVRKYIQTSALVAEVQEELIDQTIEECQTFITENFNDTPDISFDRNAMMFRGNVNNTDLTRLLRGQCPECNVEHQITDAGYCLRCTRCNSLFPKAQIIPIEERYRHLNSFWSNYSQIINNGTVNNIVNIYNGTDLEFTCDIALDNSIFRNRQLTSIFRQILDGHKITRIAEAMHYMNKDFVYTKGVWYFFDGSIWIVDEDNLIMKRYILNMSSQFTKIINFYEARRNRSTDEQNLIKNVKSLVNKLNKPGFKDDIIKEAKMFYNDPRFISKLNSKKHLVPFENGVYDLIQMQFRKTTKEDYVNLTMGYNYDASINCNFVWSFITSVLPNECVRNYVLKKMSECLNGDIPNTHFLMLIGDGANGKSQILNLMKLTMGDFGEKVEVTLLTRKRSNANEANTEKMKLINKRFAFLSEPEDGEKINVGLLKEATGSEELVARGLYQEPVSFVMEAKLFLACNELPEIKGEDTALWRRIRVVDFPSRFVDEPKEDNEYAIDRTLPSKMREDVTWRQSFVNILISFYDKTVEEPDEVKVRTNEYRSDNNDFYNWLTENIEYKEGSVLQLSDICRAYTGTTTKKVHSSVSAKYKPHVERFVKENFRNPDPNVDNYTHKVIKCENNKSVRGWKHLVLKDD